MSAEPFRQLDDLFHAAREATPEKRAVLLATADPELRRQVELLLRMDGDSIPDFSTVRDVPPLPDDETSTVATPEVRLGPYRIERKLGHGGMGEVFRAIDTRLGRAVAIKTNRAEFNPRFEREARAISSLNHPNICTLYDVGPNYLVMELVEGETLAARIKHGPVPIPTVLQFGAQIAAALVEAHGKGIVHRDLKPGNIMIGKTGIKVLDFGLARTEEDETVTVSRMIVGTPAYMAPEQRAGNRVDARADIYALGCVLYEMLTGERAARQRKPIGSRKLNAIVERCLEEDPARRWQSATELLRELEARIVPDGDTEAISSAAVKPSRTHKILLGEFENKTSDPAFDGILRQGLSVELEQSTTLTLISDQHVQQALRFMVRPPATRLTPEVGQEICERMGGAVVMEGSIAKLGSQYILWLRARNCHTGDILVQEQARAGNEEEALNALTRIAGQIREQLTETLDTIEKLAAPLDQATTPSLEALKAFTAGHSIAFIRGFTAAIPHLQRAIAIDPQFALAHAILGFYYGNTGQTELGTRHILKGYELRDLVSERERFYILFLYDRQVTGNAHKELATIEAWAQTFPLDFHPWGILGGWGTRGTGQYERGIQGAKESIRLNADAPFPYDGLASHYMSLGRFPEATGALQKAAERGLEIPNFLIHRYYLAFLDGDEAGMKREIDRARGHRESEDWMAHNQALVLAYSGKMRDARTMWHHAIMLAQQNGDPGRAAIYQAAAAVCEAHCGNRAAARERAQAALALGKGRDVLYAAAFALSHAGDDAGSLGLAEEMARQFREDTPVQFEYLPILGALSALARDTPLKAIENLLTALPYDFAMPGTAFFARFGGLYSVYVRGQAYLQAGQCREAAAEFQKILDHRGIVLADPVGALAFLQLGRSLVPLGQIDRARRAYQEFLTLWKDADTDISVLREARAEYSKL